MPSCCQTLNGELGRADEQEFDKVDSLYHHQDLTSVMLTAIDNGCRRG
jgi:hypothetical protein